MAFANRRGQCAVEAAIGLSVLAALALWVFSWADSTPRIYENVRLSRGRP